MIFVTLGSQKFQFNRLLKVIDELIDDGTIEEEVYAQIGYSDYIPVNYSFKHFFDREEFAYQINKADIIITHGGTGAIISAVKKRKRVIAVPRLAEFGEHVDNHQLQLINQFKELELIYECLDVNKLGDSLRNLKNYEYKEYQSNTTKIIESIMQYLEENL